MKIRILTVLAPAMALGACVAEPALPIIQSGGLPSNTGSGIRSDRYSSPIGDYVHRRPVDPGNWRQQNDSQAPGSES